VKINNALREVAREENISIERLTRRVKNGSVVLAKNSKRNIRPLAIGSDIRTKINANIGFSTKKNLKTELKKAKIAIEYGTDTIMDLSVSNFDKIRRTLIKKINIPLGTVPIYQAFIEKKFDMNLDSILDTIEKNCRDGVDFMTLHCGITKELAENLNERIIPIASRGGCFLSVWMLENTKENPLYTGFNEILEIVKEYDVVISLGDALRPGSVLDASDRFQIQELINLGRLTKIARREKVPVIIEGPGHLPLDQIEMNVLLEKKICDNAPFYVLGPLVTDIAIGYDHITGAIGGAIAGMYGADFLCYVTPAEHLGLPGIEDVKNGVIASKIAAHAADLVKLKDYQKDLALSIARKDLNWSKQFNLGIKGYSQTKYPLVDKNVCTMCGAYCTHKTIREYLKK